MHEDGATTSSRIHTCVKHWHNENPFLPFLYKVDTWIPSSCHEEPAYAGTSSSWEEHVLTLEQMAVGREGVVDIVIYSDGQFGDYYMDILAGSDGSEIPERPTRAIR